MNILVMVLSCREGIYADDINDELCCQTIVIIRSVCLYFFFVKRFELDFDGLEVLLKQNVWLDHQTPTKPYPNSTT